MVVHYRMECHIKKSGYYLQGQGHHEGLCNQNMIVSLFLLFTSFLTMTLTKELPQTVGGNSLLAWLSETFVKIFE